jgi:hypothetical protein
MRDGLHSMIHNTNVPPNHNRSCEAYTLVLILVLPSQIRKPNTRTPFSLAMISNALAGRYAQFCSMVPTPA